MPDAPASRGDRDHADREREHRRQHRELDADREARGDRGQHPRRRVLGLGVSSAAAASRKNTATTSLAALPAWE